MAQHRYVSKKPESSAIVADRACRYVHGLIANFSGQDAWIWLIDSNTASGDRPDGVPLKVANGDCRSLDQEVLNKPFSRGLYVLASSDPYAKTIIATVDGSTGIPATGFLFEFAVDLN